jgi:tetratricopeptide (TPR) repeat protein/CHAT domain-containing protein
MLAMKHQMKRWIMTLLIVCLLLSGLTGSAFAQDHQAELAEAKKLDNQALTLYKAGRYDEAIVLAKRLLAIQEKALGSEHPDVANSLNRLAVLYNDKGDYAQAEPLYKRALAIFEKTLGLEHPDAANSLNNLAGLYRNKGDYAQAEPLYKRALAIREKVLGSEHPDVANSLNNLATLYDSKADYAQAEPLYKRALAIFEKALGLEHPDIARSLHNLAALYKSKGDYVQAESLYKRALAIREKALGSEHPDVATSLNSLATLYNDKGDYARAEPLLKRALAIREKVLGLEHRNVATSLHNLAALYKSKGDYAQAEPLYKRALTIFEKALGSEHPNVANSLNNLAQLYKSKGDYAEAESLFKRALAIREKALGLEHPDVAISLNNLATLYDRKADYAQAEPLYKRALAIFEKVFGLEHRNVATSLSNLAELYKSKGDYAEAEPLYKRALAIREKALGSEHPDVAYSLNNLATLYNDKGDYAKAEPLFKRALTIFEKALGLEHPDVATSFNNLATLYRGKGDYAEAEPLYKRALAIREKALGSEHPDVGNFLNNLAELYKNKGDYAKAESLFKRALAIREKALGLEHPDVANSLNNLATLYDSKADYAQAEPLYKRALAIFEKLLGSEHPNVATSLNNLAFLYYSKGDYAQAEPLYKRALAIREKALGGEHPDVATSLNNLALLYNNKGDYIQAEPLYKRALAIIEKSLGLEHPDVATSLNNLATLYQGKGVNTQVLQLLAREAEIREHNLKLILATSSERQKQLYLDTLCSETDTILSFHIHSAPHDKQAAQLVMTTILQRKGRVLDAMADQFAILQRNATLQNQQLLAEWKQTRSYLATLQISGTTKLTPAQQQIEVARLIAEVERLEDELSRNSETFRTQVTPITVDAVRQAIPANAALVEIVAYRLFNAKAKNVVEKRGEPRYAAYVLRQNQTVPQWVELGDAEAIDSQVKQFRAALKDPKSQDVRTIARSLDEQVMRPIRKLLGSTRQILLSPDGALNLIPFEALVDEQGKYLIENYSLSYLTSGRDLLRLHQSTDNPSASVVVANPLYDLTMASQVNLVIGQGNSSAANSRSIDFTLKNYKPLPGTAEEAAALGKLLPKGTRVLLQEQATEAALKQVNHPRILHIATHGFFLSDQVQAISANKVAGEALDNLSSLPANWENPLLRSGLILAGVKQGQRGADDDGVLTALEVSVLDLWGTKLVVLSACETGLGEVQNGVGVYGLRRALVLAGSETQVMSLWKVSDGGTRDLMTAYYRRLQAGEGRTEALRQVQLAMLRGQLKAATTGKGGQQEEDDRIGEAPKDYRHPYYWAAFIPSGDWRNMQGKEAGVR